MAVIIDTFREENIDCKGLLDYNQQKDGTTIFNPFSISFWNPNGVVAPPSF